MPEKTLFLKKNSALTNCRAVQNTQKLETKPKILVVEDNFLNQKIAQIFLEDMGYQVDIAENGSQALQMFNQEYSGILMDIGLPDMDGCDVCSSIRKLDYGKDIPIIALTASGDFFKDKCLAAGMNSYLTKPIINEDLKNELYQFIPIEAEC
ncbi:MAG: Sensor histidine kinase RcsC [Legionellaceae bacterium]